MLTRSRKEWKRYLQQHLLLNRGTDILKPAIIAGFKKKVILAFDPARQLEEQYGLKPYDVSEKGAKYYRKDIGKNASIEITLISGGLSISINSTDENIILIPVAERYVPKNDSELDFLLTGSSRLSTYFA